MSLEEEFKAKCLEGYEIAKNELGYNATYYLKMIYQHGAVQSAKILVSKPVSDGLHKLWEFGRLDLTIEHHMLNPKFKSLFTPEELKTAQKRLKDLDYTPSF